MKAENIFQIIINWIVLITAPIWIIPFCLYEVHKSHGLDQVFLEGKKSIFG